MNLIVGGNMCVSVYCIRTLPRVRITGSLGASKAFSWRIFLWVDFHFGLNASAVVGTKHVSVMQATLSNEHEQKKKEKDF